MWTWESEKKAKGVMVIVHGSGEHHGRYEWLRHQWLTSHFHVVQGDLPGQGANPKKRGHIDQFEDYIEEVTRWYEVASQFDLPIYMTGHSLGGLVIIRTLQEKQLPVDGVILSSPALGLANPPPSPIQKIARFVDRIKPDLRVPIKRSPVNHNATRNRVILERDLNDPYLVTKISIRWYLELEKAIQEAFLAIDHFPDVPLLILQGGSDKIVNKKEVKRWYDTLHMSFSDYKEWPELYHEVFNEPEREDVFNNAHQFILHLLSNKEMN